MSKAIVIYSSKPTFRRAGLGFTENGTAFAEGQLSAEQIKAIKAEKYLSYTEIDRESVAEGIDTSPYDEFTGDGDGDGAGAGAGAKQNAPAEKKPAAKTTTKAAGK
jgi:hypothetical protein